MSNNSKKLKSILTTSLAAVMSAGALVGISVPLANQAQQSSSLVENENVDNDINNGNNENNNNNIDRPSNENNESVKYVDTNDGRISTRNLTFQADLGKSRIIKGEVNSKNDYNLRMSQVKNNEDKWNKMVKVTTVSGNEKEVKRSTSYTNDRKFMPILAYDNDNYYSYTDTRSNNDVSKNIFPGWNKNNTTHYYSKYFGLTTFDYTPTKINKEANPKISDKIEGLEIRLWNLDKEFNSNKQKIKDAIDSAIRSTQPEFIYITDVENDNQDLISDLESLYTEGKGPKKMLINGTYTNINGMKLPSTLLELDFQSENFTQVNPLKLPKSAALIHESAGSRYANFTSIELGSSVTEEKTKLTNEDLQEAVNVVYEQRIKERAFQSHWAGGYISSWNLRKTGLYSFNKVNIPKLEDGTGRFYISYVAIDSESDQGPDKDESIGNENGNGPSNDSQIGEWFDWNENGWSKVENVTVTSNGKEIVMDVAVKEILGFMNKYPNIKKIDISGLKLAENKTLEKLKIAIKNAIDSKYGSDSKYSNIEIIIEKATN